MANRQQLSDLYIVGPASGLEVAGLHNPWPVPRGTQVIQLDLFDTVELRKQYPEMCHKPFVDVQVLGDAQTLACIPSSTMDFVLSSHVIEHVPGVIEALTHWMRVLKTGKHLLMAVPLSHNQIDKDRVPTTVEHILNEWLVSRDNPELRDQMLKQDYYDYFSVVDKLKGDALDQRVSSAMKDKPHVHFHCWTYVGLLELLNEFCERFGATVVHAEPTDHEALIVIRKENDWYCGSHWTNKVSSAIDFEKKMK